MTMPKTITTEQYNDQVVKVKHVLSDVEVEFKLSAQIPEHSYEDRQVFFAMDEYGMSMRGEEAIELGQKLITEGTKALQSNMYQHHHIHAEQFLQKMIREGKVERLVFTVTDENPANHGEGWRTHSIKPIWKDEEEMEDYSDFQFDTIMYWSPDEEEFAQQKAVWGIPVDIIGYDREADVLKFQAMVEHFSRQNDERELEARAEALNAVVEEHGVEAIMGLPIGPSDGDDDEDDDSEADAREAYHRS